MRTRTCSENVWASCKWLPTALPNSPSTPSQAKHPEATHQPIKASTRPYRVQCLGVQLAVALGGPRLAIVRHNQLGAAAKQSRGVRVAG